MTNSGKVGILMCYSKPADKQIPTLFTVVACTNTAHNTCLGSLCHIHTASHVSELSVRRHFETRMRKETL